MAIEWALCILIAIITALLFFIWRSKRDHECVPKGTIIMWSGSDIPKGWVLCNGMNGTPNLSGRFVMGYSSSCNHVIGDGGGSHKHVHNINIQKTSLNINQIPSHDHTSAAWGLWKNNGGLALLWISHLNNEDK